MSEYLNQELGVRFEIIYNIKSNISNEVLCKGLPNEMCEYMNYVKALKFDEEPNYNELKKLFISILDNMNEKCDFNFSWSKKKVKKNNFSLMTSFQHFREKSLSRFFSYKKGASLSKSLSRFEYEEDENKNKYKYKYAKKYLDTSKSFGKSNKKERSVGNFFVNSLLK